MICLILGISLVSAAPAGTWTFQSPFDVTVDLKNDGTLIKATNFGNNPAAQAVVRGIVFDTNWSNTNAASLYNDMTVYYTGSDPEIAKLMNQSAQNYTWNWSGPRQFNITLSGLQIGHVYRIQLLTVGETAHGNDFFINDWQEYSYFWMNDGQFVLATYVWTANAASLTISNNVNWSHGSGSVNVMGYAVHELPMAHSPNPANNAFVTPQLSTLNWSVPDPNVPGTQVTSYVYFGSRNPADTEYYFAEPNLLAPAFGLTPIPDAQGISATSVAIPIPLTHDTEYYWAVNCNDPSRNPSTLPGQLWKFTTVEYKQMAHWPLDGLAGGLYPDSSGEGHNADPVGATQYFVGMPDAVKGNALIVDVNSVAAAGTWNPSGLTNQFTISGWFKADAPGGSVQGLITKNNADTKETSLWKIIINAAGQLQLTRPGGNTLTSITVPADEWIFMAITWDNNDTIIYTYNQANPEDVKYFSTVEGTFSLDGNTASTINLGCSYIDAVNGPVAVFDGFFDEFQIYNYAKSAMQVADLYNEAGDESFCIAEYADALDVTGPDGAQDCVVNLYDFAGLAAEWMTSGLYPVLP